MDVDVALLLLQFEAVRVSVVESVAVQDDRCAECTCRFDFEDRRCCGHADDGVHAEFLRGVGDPLRMIARRGGDDAARPLLLRKHGDAIVCAAQLECARGLEILELQIGRIARDVGEELTVYQRGLSHNALEPFCRGIDIRNPCRCDNFLVRLNSLFFSHNALPPFIPYI